MKIFTDRQFHEEIMKRMNEYDEKAYNRERLEKLEMKTRELEHKLAELECSIKGEVPIRERVDSVQAIF